MVITFIDGLMLAVQVAGRACFDRFCLRVNTTARMAAGLNSSMKEGASAYLVRGAEVKPPRRQPHHCRRHHNTGGRDAAHVVQPCGHVVILHGGPRHGHQPVDRHALRVRRQRGKLQKQAHPVALTLAEPDDAAGAHADARAAHVGDRVEAVLVVARARDGRVELARGVEVVVVGREARGAQLACLLRREHAERGADLHVERADFADHVEHALPLARPHLREAHCI